MKGTDKIIAHIQADAKGKAQEILAAAKAKADEISSNYAAQAKEAYDKAMAINKKESDAMVESMSRMNEMESKKDALALKQKMVGDAFDKARDIILNLPKEEYEAFLVKLAVEGIQAGDEELVLNEKDKAAYGEAVVKKANATADASIKLSEETGDFAGGLILRRGNIEANSTLELLIESSRSKMSADVAKVLFG